MIEFVASNGIRIVRSAHEGFYWVWEIGSDSYVLFRPEEEDALREFFQAERDEELGRWRWPENPDYVVYRQGAGWLVLDETTGATKHYSYRSHAAVGNSLLSQAARAYFEAHPERKPWHDAKPGEVWALTYGDTEGVFLISGDSWYGQGDMRGVVLDHPIRDSNVKAGRRIWPEG